MSDLPEIPYRTKGQIVADFKAHADLCANGTDTLEEYLHCFNEALHLILDARLPRADDDDDLREMIERADKDGPTFTTEEVFASLEKRGDEFSAYLTRYRALLELEAWEQAALMLHEKYLDGYDVTISSFTNDCRIDHPSLSGGAVSASSRSMGLSMLAAIMRAHASWKELWKR